MTAQHLMCRNVHGKSISISVKNEECIDTSRLTAFPAVIDPHVHFRVPGWEHKEDWTTGARAAFRGGVSMVFDMPNTSPPTITADLLREKQAIIASQLQAAQLPLDYRLFFGADKHHFSEIAKVKNDIIGIKVFMGCSTGNLVIDDDLSLATVFAIAAEHDLLVAVHAEDEHAIQQRKIAFKDRTDFAVHSCIRDEQVACSAVEKAINLSAKYGTRLYVLHVSSREEIALIRQAKHNKVPVFAETTPHHLFLNDSYYATLQGKAQVNPPLRHAGQQQHLLAAIEDGTIDTIGSDHAPHTEAEKKEPYGACPSGMPGIEFLLPLLLNAHYQGKLSLATIARLTSQRAREIFRLPPSEDVVLCDLQETKAIQHTYSKCGWSPYMGMTLTGWPKYLVKDHVAYSLA